MKILPIKQNSKPINYYAKRNSVIKECPKHTNSQVIYPANYYMLSFRGANIAKMYEEYNWYIRNDRVPAIKSFLKMSAPKEEMDEFLTHILNTKDRSYELIDSISSMPREAVNILKELTEKVGANSKNIMTFFQDSPYCQAYRRYIEEKFENAHNITELLKIRPDWSGEILMKKHFSKANNDELTIGNLPKRIPAEHWKKIIPYLREKMEIGLKPEKKIENLVIDNRVYKFKYFTEGKSSKNVFGVFAPQVAKKYVVKLDSPCKRSLDEPFALGTLAKIDGYLTLNSSRNSAPLCYYNHKGNFSIYKYIEHTNIKEQTNDISIITKHLPDFKALGLDYNDTVGYKNFFILTEKSSDTHWKMVGFQDALNKNEWISVDNDHVTYNNRLQPFVNGFNKTLPNAMGMFF